MFLRCTHGKTLLWDTISVTNSTIDCSLVLSFAWEWMDVAKIGILEHTNVNP